MTGTAQGSYAPGSFTATTEDDVKGAPQQHLLHLLAGKMVSATVCTLAKIGLADHLADGPASVATLAELTESDEDMLYRFLRTAAAVDVLTEHDGRVFELTDVGNLLRSDVPGSIRYLAYLYGEESVWNCFAHADHTLRTGEPAGPLLRDGQGWFEYMEHQGEYADVFHRAMTGVSNRAPEVAAAYDFGRFTHVADVGGGQGRLLSAVLAANPGQRGTLFDTASALADAATVLHDNEVGGRVDCVVGDFFEAVPSGPDAYLLKAILHDWNDTDALRILRNIRAAIGDNAEARVFVVEAVLPGRNEWHFSKAMDIAMAVSLGGKERDLDQWRTLFVDAGFELVGATRSAPPHSIIEASPIPRRDS